MDFYSLCELGAVGGGGGFDGGQDGASVAPGGRTK